MLKEVLVLHHPQSEGAVVFATQTAREFARHAIPATVADAWASDVPERAQTASLIVCVGGDGTVLRTARAAVPQSAPILGINMGRLGFLTDLSPRDFFNHFERILAEDWRIEERVMVHADLVDGDPSTPRSFDALNDIVVSRQSPGRPIYVHLSVDGTHLANYRCDGMIVATPTGSTGYSLSAGGPIIAPTEDHLVVTPVSPHLALGRSLVLSPDARVELRVISEHGAILSVDGQEDVPVANATVHVRLSPYRTRFVRFQDPASFYGALAEKLDIQLSSTMGTRA